MNGMYYLRQPIKINTIMTKIQETLVALPEEKKALFIPAFGDVDKFYTTVYLIARNEHVTELENRTVMKTACR